MTEPSMIEREGDLWLPVSPFGELPNGCVGFFMATTVMAPELGANIGRSIVLFNLTAFVRAEIDAALATKREGA